jgi:DNA-binding Lrp family transcriptional regulator
MSPDEALQRVRGLRQSGIIRRIGAVIDSRRLGLSGTLVAMKVPTEQIEDVAAIVNALPNVTHNYLRDHEYNMWFTVTAESPADLTQIIGRIRETTGIRDILDLRSVKTYKINVRLDFSR